ncbi:MAG TPA: hypothetical protein VFH56_02135 [Acidimicrobiales bacterium]|nr:hypothetical protein [Acidimicrobiales bacterium]
MAAWPAVKAAIAAGAAALPAFADAEIYVGPQATNDAPLKFFEVGFVNDENNAGTYARALAYDGTVWSETGDVRSTITANAGDSDPSIAEADAFTMADALAAWIQGDPTLGRVLSPDSEVHVAVDVLSISNARGGTATELVLTLTYTTTV